MSQSIYPAFIKYTQSLLEKHKTSLHLAINPPKKEDDHHFIYVGIEHNHTSIQQAKQNKTIEQIIQIMKDSLIDNPKKLQICVDTTRIASITKAWFNNLIKLQPSVSEIHTLYQSVFYHYNTADLLGYLKPENKDYAKTIVLAMKPEFRPFSASANEFIETFKILNKFNFTATEEEEILLNLCHTYKKSYVPKMGMDFINAQEIIFKHISEKYPPSSWDRFLDYIPEYADSIKPQLKKDSLFIEESSYTAFLLLDPQYVSQHYPILVQEDKARTTLRMLGVCIDDNKDLFNLKGCKVDMNTQIRYLISADSPIDLPFIKTYLFKVLDMYVAEKEKGIEPSRMFLNRGLQYLMIQDNLNISDKETKTANRPKI